MKVLAWLTISCGLHDARIENEYEYAELQHMLTTKRYPGLSTSFDLLCDVQLSMKTFDSRTLDYEVLLQGKPVITLENGRVQFNYSY